MFGPGRGSPASGSRQSPARRESDTIYRIRSVSCAVCCRSAAMASEGSGAKEVTSRRQTRGPTRFCRIAFLVMPRPKREGRSRDILTLDPNPKCPSAPRPKGSPHRLTEGGSLWEVGKVSRRPMRRIYARGGLAARAADARPICCHAKETVMNLAAASIR